MVLWEQTVKLAANEFALGIGFEPLAINRFEQSVDLMCIVTLALHCHSVIGIGVYLALGIAMYIGLCVCVCGWCCGL